MKGEVSEEHEIEEWLHRLHGVGDGVRADVSDALCRIATAPEDSDAAFDALSDAKSRLDDHRPAAHLHHAVNPTLQEGLPATLMALRFATHIADAYITAFLDADTARDIPPADDFACESHQEPSATLRAEMRATRLSAEALPPPPPPRDCPAYARAVVSLCARWFPEAGNARGTAWEEARVARELLAAADACPTAPEALVAALRHLSQQGGAEQAGVGAGGAPHRLREAFRYDADATSDFIPSYLHSGAAAGVVGRKEQQQQRQHPPQQQPHRLPHRTTPTYFPANERAALATACQKLGAERSRLWAARGMREDGTTASDSSPRRTAYAQHTARTTPPPPVGQQGGFSLLEPASWFGGGGGGGGGVQQQQRDPASAVLGWFRFEGLKCGPKSAEADHPTSALLEQLVQEVAQGREAVRRAAGGGGGVPGSRWPEGIGEFFLRADVALRLVDPEWVRSGGELAYYREVLAGIEEQILDAAPPALVSRRAAGALPVSGAAQALHRIKQSLNTLHGILQARCQAMREPLSPVAAKYQEFFTLCQAHLETVQTTEYRLPLSPHVT